MTSIRVPSLSKSKPLMAMLQPAPAAEQRSRIGSRAILDRLGRRAQVKKPGDAFMRLELQYFRHASIIGAPVGVPLAAYAERGCRQKNILPYGSSRQLLLPFGNFRMRCCARDKCEHHR